MASAPYNYSYIFKYIIIGKWPQNSEASLVPGPNPVLDSDSDSVSGDMGVGKSCILHQFTEKKCK